MDEQEQSELFRIKGNGMLYLIVCIICIMTEGISALNAFLCR